MVQLESCRVAARKSNVERIEDLVTAATAVFARKGFRRARMDEIARAAGVSPGNIYNYVTSKDALFALVMRRALSGVVSSEPPEWLPIDGPPAAETIAWVGKRLDYVSDFPEFEAALTRRRVRDPAAEVTAVVNELFDVLLAINDGATILERSGPEM